MLAPNDMAVVMCLCIFSIKQVEWGIDSEKFRKLGLCLMVRRDDR